MIDEVTMARDELRAEGTIVQFAVSGEDAELDAALVAVNVLDQLDPSAARRVVSYLTERF